MLELAKLIHQTFGVSSPRMFIAAFAVTGLLLFGGLGWLIDKGYRMQIAKDASSKSLPEIVLDPPSTPYSGDQFTASRGAYQKEKITLHGPDGMEFLIYFSGGSYLCRILNGSLSIISKFQATAVNSRTFDVARLMWRDPVPFAHAGMMLTRTATNPGDFTPEVNFATPSGSAFRIGDTASSLLGWPTGDQNHARRWRVKIVVRSWYPAKQEAWPIDLCVRWTPETGMEFMEYRDAIPPSDF